MVHKTGVHLCPECPKTFTRLEYVNRHRRLKHLGIRPWGCACGVSYARSDLLCRHKRKCPQALGEAQLAVTGPPPSTIPNSGVNPPPGHGPSLFEPSGSSDFLHGDLYAGAQPPPYDQAIGYNPAPHISNQVWVQLPALIPPSNDAQQSYVHHRRPSPPSGYTNAPADFGPLPARLKPNAFVTQVQQTPDYEEEIASYEQPREAASSHDASQSHQLESDDVPQISHPASRMVRYSDPTFFITEEPTSSPYYLNPNLWVIAFLCQRGQGFTIPTVGTLSKYMRKATVDMLSIIPMIHVPTLKASVISIHLGYALCVAGASTDSSEHAIAFANQSLLYKRPLVQRDFEVEVNPFDFRFELLQTLLTYQFLGIFNRIDHQRHRAGHFNRTLVENFKNLALTQLVQNAPDYVKLVLEDELPLDLAWRSWAKYETHKRTVFLVLMSAYQLDDSPGLTIEDANVPLPCHEDVWTAPDAESWLLAMYRHTSKCLTDGKPAIGEESIPSLIDGLAALSLNADDQPAGSSSADPVLTATVVVNPAGPSTALSPGRQNKLRLSPSVRAISSVAPPHIRQLGNFANLVLSHCNKISTKNVRFAGNMVHH